jgi:hypothetical protein
VTRCGGDFSRGRRHGETTKLTSGAHVAVTEGEGVAAGLRRLEEEAASGNYAKAAGPFGTESEEKFFSE